jgi:peptidoglycan glycosyltransferase
LPASSSSRTGRTRPDERKPALNRQIVRVSIVALVLLASLVVGTTYWQTWASEGLKDRQDNAIQSVAQFTIRRGLIYTADGKLLAARRARPVNGQTFYFRRYPSGPLAAQVVGYSTQSRSRAGLERAENDYLTASNSQLNTVLRRTLDRLKGETVTGNNLKLTIDSDAQRVALEALGDNCGAAVALEPSTGRVLAMASAPSYNPNLVEGRFGAIARQARGANCSSPSPLVNRATAGLYTPGSTFKVITAAAALDTGTYTPDSSFVDPGYCIEYGKKVFNYADQSGPEVFGRVDFASALEHSINAVFCEVGKKLGPLTVLDYARRFGFYSEPPLETPSDERVPSGLYNRGRLFRPSDPNQVDPGRLAFGQERLQVTPLQMAMATAAIANGGVVMKPYVVERISEPDGDLVSRTRPEPLRRAIRPETAAALTSMMERVVASGTGTAAQISGVSVAGKTGTAETGVPGVNTTSFLAFAPADAPKVAVAVVLENQRGVGGRTAAPIAKQIMETLLRGSA